MCTAGAYLPYVTIFRPNCTIFYIGAPGDLRQPGPVLGQLYPDPPQQRVLQSGLGSGSGLGLGLGLGFGFGFGLWVRVRVRVRVAVRDRVEQLQEEALRHGLCHALVPLGVLVQVAPVGVLHDEVDGARRLDDLVERDHALVAQQLEDADLVLHLLRVRARARVRVRVRVRVRRMRISCFTCSGSG